MKIMVVDDSRTGRFYILKTLLIGGVPESDVLLIENGQEALNSLEKNKDVGLVFLDIVMPVMNGMVVVEEIEKRKLMPCSRIIITSSLSDATRIGILKSKGVQHFLKKPFTPEDVTSIYQIIKKETI